MKKIYLVLITLFTLAFNVKAQQPPCEGGCVAVSTNTFIDTLCLYNWRGQYTSASVDTSLYPNGVVPLIIKDAPCIFVFVNYTIFNCNGVTKLQIDGTVFFDVTNALNETFSDSTWTLLTSSNPSFPVINLGTNNQKISNFTPCATFTSAAILQAQIDAVSKLVAKLNLPLSVETYYKGACFSLVEVQWPAGAFKTYPATGDNPGGGPITINLSNSKTTISIPCNDACCKITYEYRIRTTQQGLTEHYYQPTFSPADESCGMSPLPNYNNYPYRMTAVVIDTVTRDSSIVYGSVVSQEPCELICNKYNAPPPGSFTTDVKNVAEKHILEFSANPTLINSFIKFTSNKAIKNVSVFDMTGKKVMTTSLSENNELNTVELKQGQYFIQVNFIDNSVKTIKVVKQ